VLKDLIAEGSIAVAGEKSETFRCVYEIARGYRSSPQLIASEHAREDKEAFRASSIRQL
jgi:hypothetical protein